MRLDVFPIGSVELLVLKWFQSSHVCRWFICQKEVVLSRGWRSTMETVIVDKAGPTDSGNGKGAVEPSATRRTDFSSATLNPSQTIIMSAPGHCLADANC